MKIKYIPVSWNPYAKIEAFPDTVVEFADENSIRIDGELYEFDESSVVWPDIRAQTNGIISEAHRDDGELYLTVMRFYTGSCLAWDTGDYHEIHG